MVARYPYADGAPRKPPDFGRVAAGLSDADLEDEILAGRGEPDYQAALVHEHERRARAGAPEAT